MTDAEHMRDLIARYRDNEGTQAARSAYAELERLVARLKRERARPAS